MAIPPHLRSLKSGMAEKLGYYVYLYVDPRDGKVFYIGKGKGERCLDHLYEDDDHPKAQRIRDIFAGRTRGQAAPREVTRLKVADGGEFRSA
jgi:hypothetical protein